MRPPEVFIRMLLRYRRLLLACIVSVAVRSTAQIHSPEFATTVVPRAGENLAENCTFKMTIPSMDKPVRAVWLTYDRGFDIMKYYDDPAVVSFAQKHGIALLLAHQCPAKDPPTREVGEMDMDMSRGVARSIDAALDDLAKQSGHSEIGRVKLIVLGFSGMGAMFAHYVQYDPRRVLAAVLANPGQTEPYGMATLRLSDEAMAVPQFIIVGAKDNRGGTQRPYEYFRRHWERGAPWTFLVQNGIPHCCVMNVKTLLLHWLDAVMQSRELPSGSFDASIDTHRGWTGYVRSCSADEIDTFKEHLWKVCAASIQAVKSTAPASALPAAWLPNRRLALEWRAFIQEKEHPQDSFPDGLDAAHSRFAVH
jgi:dienelactone hydrolase